MTSHTKVAIASLLASTMLAACGGSDTPAGGLNPAISGTWNGTTTLTIPGQAPVSYAGQLIISASGSSAVASRVCMDGSGSVTMTGSGNAAFWSGVLVCPGIAVTCNGLPGTLVVTLNSASGTLSANETTLTAQGSGSATACGGSSSITFSFVGTKA